MDPLLVARIQSAETISTTEYERLQLRRTELWHLLSDGHDSEVAAEVKALDDELNALWDEHRAAKAERRFGTRDRIITRARAEERLERAA